MSAFTIASRCRYVATLVLVVLAIPTESATTQSIRRAFDDFDPSIDESQWSSYQGVTTAAGNCGQTALSGNALYFDGIEERQMSTKDLKTTSGGFVRFYLAAGNLSTCGVVSAEQSAQLAYSTDGGHVYTELRKYVLNDTVAVGQWSFLEEVMPMGAMSGSTRFRWRYVGSGGTNWFAIDNFEVLESAGAGSAPFLWSLSPTRGSTSGAVTVYINGTNFRRSDGLSCRFGSTVATALYVSPFLIACDTPAHAGGSVQLVVLNDLTDESSISNELQFVFDEPAYLTTFYPTKGPESGGTQVEVHGDHFIDTPKLTCRFGEHAYTPGIYSSASVIFCRAPEHYPGNVTLQISTNQIDFEPNQLTYEFQTNVNISSLLPLRGPTEGGTAVTVEGSNFPQWAHLGITCRFDGKVVSATWVSSTQIVCGTPALSEGYRGVDVSVNNQDYTPSKLMFEFFSKDAAGTQLVPYVQTEDGESYTLAAEEARGWTQANETDMQYQYMVLPTIIALDPARGSFEGGSKIAVIVSGIARTDGECCLPAHYLVSILSNIAVLCRGDLSIRWYNRCDCILGFCVTH